MIICGDCREVMATMDAESVSAIVTDPPYGLSFMGKAWDHGVPGVEFWTAALRVLKPGGHLLAFGGTRTYHRLACAIEDAGFEVRDSIHWVYGSGFPKSLDVSKALDAAVGADREVIGTKVGLPGYSLAPDKGRGVACVASGDSVAECAITAPATDAAREWSGWGTALKPAHEPIIVARKPLAGTVVANVLAHGTGAINVDGCRAQVSLPRPLIRSFARESKTAFGDGLNGSQSDGTTTAGRWPPNFLLSHAPACGDACAPACPVVEMDRQSGNRPGMSGGGKHRAGYEGGMFGGIDSTATARGDSGGASRFFPVFRYEAKASKRDRGAGNNHPTVKPRALMEWLIRLVTPPGGLVLDPFAGSGTTLVAAQALGVRAVGIELMPEHCDIARARLREAMPLFEAAQ